MDKSQSPSKLKFIDNSSYPIGVSTTVTGIISITQPDGVTINGNFATPDVFWSGSSLTQPLKELRLDTAGNFQNGAYTIVYTVRAPGYSDTVLTKSFSLQYTPPIPIVTQGFDLFTPRLVVTDSTSYGQSGFNFLSTTWQWASTIYSVNGTPQTIAGSLQTFDLNYQGSYYDAKYTVNLTVIPSWQMAGLNSWVTLIDSLAIPQQIYYAEIPPSYTVLLQGLDAMKTALDAASCNNNEVLTENYLLAEAIFSHYAARGCAGDLAGLSYYVYQLQKLFNGGTIPPYVNTNAVIPAYVWSNCSGGSSSWSGITGKPSTAVIEWVVGTGGFPGNGATTLTDARLANANVRVFRSGLKQLGSNPGDGTSYYTKVFGSYVVFFFPALSTGEVLSVENIPL
jgi:hypothetical protein